MRVIWSRLADAQVDDAMAYISADRPSAALSWLERLLEQAKLLGKFPDQGRVVPELERNEIREIMVKPYRVIYRRAETTVEIVAICHMSREHLEDSLE